MNQPEEKLETLKSAGRTAIYKGFSLPYYYRTGGRAYIIASEQDYQYEHVIPQLVAVEENPNISGLLVILNTVGGDVEAGLAIAEAIASMSKPTVSIVLGGGHSIGTTIAVSADYSFIAPSATMTIHPIRLTGLVIGVPQTRIPRQDARPGS